MTFYSSAHRITQPNLGESELAHAWDMVPVDNAIPDLVGANNGTITGGGTIQTLVGPMRSMETGDQVNFGNIGTIQTLVFTINPATLTEEFFLMDAGAAYSVEVTAGTITATGWNDPSIYVDGVLDATLVANKIQRVCITTAIGVAADRFILGGVTPDFTGAIGEIEVYTDERTAYWAAVDAKTQGLAVAFKTGYSYPLSVAAEGGVLNQVIGGSGSPIKAVDIAGRFRLQAGTVNGKTCKILQCDTSGDIYIPTSYFKGSAVEAAFGTWDWWYYLATGTSPIMAFSAENLTAGTTEYRIDAKSGRLNLAEGLVTLITSSLYTPDDWTHIRVTRRPTGRFRFWMNEVSQGVATDTTTGIATYMWFRMLAGDKLCLGNLQGNDSFLKLLAAISY